MSVDIKYFQGALADKGIDQATMAKELNWTPPILSKVLNGKRGVTAQEAMDIAKFMKEPADLIFKRLGVDFDFDYYAAQLEQKPRLNTITPEYVYRNCEIAKAARDAYAVKTHYALDAANTVVYVDDGCYRGMIFIYTPQNKVALTAFGRMCFLVEPDDGVIIGTLLRAIDEETFVVRLESGEEKHIALKSASPIEIIIP